MYPVVVKQHTRAGATIISEQDCSTLNELDNVLDGLQTEYEGRDEIGIYQEECVVKQAFINGEPVV